MTPPVSNATTDTRPWRQTDRQRVMLIVALVTILLVPTSLFGQAGSSGSASRPATAGPSSSTGPSTNGDGNASPQSFGLLKAEDGSVVPLPPGTTYEDYLKWIASRRGIGYGINSVALTGRVDDETDEQITLDAQIVIIIHRDDEWVRVPLGLSEAILTKVDHQPPDDGLNSYEGRSADDGHTWSLFGRGEHRLDLSLAVPLSERSDETQLTLGTPANAATTTLSLSVPENVEVTPVGGVVRSMTETIDRRTIDWVGAGGKLDVSWRLKPPIASPADLSVSTTLVPSFSGKSVQIRAVQEITAEQGSVSSIRIRLPQGFQLDGIVGSLYRSHTEEMSENGRIITVQLADATSSTFELTLRASAPVPADGQVVISDFSLPDVPPTAQTGRILVERSAGYNVNDGEGSVGIVRLDMADPNVANIATAYEFGAQPFRLVLTVEPVTPEFVVSPNLTFQLMPERFDLEAKFEFDVEVRRGELREVRFAWPAPEWSVAQVRVGPIQEFRRGSDSASPIDLQVPTTTPTFRIPIRATRSLGDSSSIIRIPLPRLEGTGQQGAEAQQNDALLVLRHPKNFAIAAAAAGGGMLNPLSDPAKAAGLPTTGENERLSAFAVPPDVREIELSVNRLGQEVSASAIVSLRPRGENLHVEEQLEFDILYEPLSTVRLMVPDELLRQGPEFVDGSNLPITKRTTGRTAEGKTEIELQLGASVMGRLSISTRFDVPRPGASDQAAEVVLPLVTPSETPFEVVRMRVARFPRHSISVGDDWFRHQTTRSDGQDRWITASTPQAIPIRLLPRSDVDLKNIVVNRLLLRSVVERDGNVHTVADARIDQPPRLMLLKFPPTLTPETFRWRGRTLSVDLIPDGDGQLAEIPLDAGSGPPVLSVAFRAADPETFGLFDRRSLEAFELAEDVAIEQTLWRLTLPESQHLFAGPSRYLSRFRWRFDSGIWNRETEEPFAQISEWFGTDITPVGPDFESGHQYVFSRIGTADQLSFASISRSLVVLIGAGLAIVVGYVFANGLIARKRLALAILGAILLLFWAFFPNQVQIFLQPAFFGLVLVAVATLAERFLRRREEALDASTAGQTSAVDFVTILPGEGSTSSRPAQIGSEEPTVLRAGRTPETAGRNSDIGP